MNNLVKYMPIFRVRQEETKVLTSFDFGDRIYPCIEIIKELDRVQSAPKKRKNGFFSNRKEKTFENVYIPLIDAIKAKNVFVDLPVHLKPSRGMKDHTLLFLRSVVGKRQVRTEYMKKLKPVSSKVIPVISTYSEVTGERGSIKLQEKELRPEFEKLAFRTFFNTFSRDIVQIRSIVQKNDFVIMDWEEMELDHSDADIVDIVEELKDLDCTVIVHRNQFPLDFKISEMKHEEIIDSIDNELILSYKDFSGSVFSDYVGIKKDNIGSGGTISPGFIYYDAVTNDFYGYRYRFGSHKKGETSPKLEEFETTIVPAVVGSDVTYRMKKHHLDFLGSQNEGWGIIQNIALDIESGKSAAKFKRISMEHYLHCIKCKILNGDFD